MKKLVLFVLFSILISGLFVTMYSFVSGSGLVEDSFHTKAHMNQTRGDLGVVAVDDKIYAIGGSIGDKPFEGFVGTNECYDPVSDTWVVLESMPTPRTDFAIAAYQSKIYCIGGLIGISSSLNEIGLSYWLTTDVNEVYDTVTGIWSTVAPLPVNGRLASACVVDNKIFVLFEPDAKSTPDKYWAAMYVYDPVTDVWNTKSLAPRLYLDDSVLGSIKFQLVAVDDKIIAIGGWSLNVMIYDPKTDVWSEGTSRAEFDYMRMGVVATTTGLCAPQKIYVFGEGHIADVKAPNRHYFQGTFNFVYDSLSDTWSNTTASGVLRTYFGVAVIDDVFYVVGGYGDGPTLQYVPMGYRAIPTINVVSPSTDQTYTTSDVFLKFTVDRHISKVWCCLDNQMDTVITGNTTLPKLAAGKHDVTIYVEDLFGNVGASKNINFTVTNPYLNKTNVVIIVITVGVVGVGVFFCFKNKKQAYNVKVKTRECSLLERFVVISFASGQVDKN